MEWPIRKFELHQGMPPEAREVFQNSSKNRAPLP